MENILYIIDINGNTVVEYDYDAYGNIIKSKDLTNLSLSDVNSILYKGYYYNNETKLYYCNNRYYDPNGYLPVWIQSIGNFFSKYPEEIAIVQIMVGVVLCCSGVGQITGNHYIKKQHYNNIEKYTDSGSIDRRHGRSSYYSNGNSITDSGVTRVSVDPLKTEMRAYNNSSLIKQIVIKYGRVQKQGYGIYKYEYKNWELVINSIEKIIFHFIYKG